MMRTAVLIGPEQKVRRLAQLLKYQYKIFDAQGDPNNPLAKAGVKPASLPVQLEKEIGELLGYPPEAVKKYVDEIMPIGASDRERLTIKFDDKFGGSFDDVRSFEREVRRGLRNRNPLFPSPEEVDSIPDDGVNSMSDKELRHRMMGGRR